MTISKKISFQGELGAYSHQACHQYDYHKPGSIMFIIFYFFFRCVHCRSKLLVKILAQTQNVAKVNVDYEKFQESLPNMRLKESQIASELQKHTINLDNQEKEIDRANSAVEETQIRIQQIKNDMDREQFLFDDANENMERVREEKSILEKQQGDLFLDTNDQDADPSTSQRNNNPIIDYLDFEDGYEKAVAAVFSDELIASINEEQASHWRKCLLFESFLHKHYLIQLL